MIIIPNVIDIYEKDYLMYKDEYPNPIRGFMVHSNHAKMSRGMFFVPLYDGIVCSVFFIILSNS